MWDSWFKDSHYFIINRCIIINFRSLSEADLDQFEMNPSFRFLLLQFRCFWSCKSVKQLLNSVDVKPDQVYFHFLDCVWNTAITGSRFLRSYTYFYLCFWLRLTLRQASRSMSSLSVLAPLTTTAAAPLHHHPPRLDMCIKWNRLSGEGGWKGFSLSLVFPTPVQGWWEHLKTLLPLVMWPV